MQNHSAIASLYAIGCALSWAICSFAAGRVSTKFSSKLLVLFYNVIAGIYFISISHFSLNALTTKFFILGILAGIGHASALSLISFALSKGRSGVVAPISTVFEISVPIMAATIFAQRYGFITYLGIVILISSIFLLRKGDEDSHETSVLTDLFFGLCAGTGFGLSISFLSFVDNDAKNNAFFVMQLGSIVFLTTLIYIGKLRGQKQLLSLTILKEPYIYKNVVFFLVFELLGVIFLNIGLSKGNGGIVAALASIPFTLGIILISVIFLKEKVTKLQMLGIAVAVGGIAITHLSTV